MSASANPRSQGLVLAVGSTGRVAGDGSLQLTGGGDLRVRIGGALNPGSVVDVNDQNGQLVNIRGNVQLQSATTGRIDLTYGSNSSEQSPGETRAFDPFQATRGRAVGGITLVPGDATFNLTTLGDLVLQQVIDPGRVVLLNNSSFTRGGTSGTGESWFSLWTGHTAIDLFSAGAT